MSRPFYEAGRYEGEVTSQGFTETSTGKPQFVLKFRVKGKIDPADPNSLIAVPAQYERTYFRVLTDKTIEYFQSDLESLSVSIASFTELDPDNPGHISLKGKTFDFYCNHEADQNGDLRERWSIARVASSGKPVESIDSSKVKQLDRLFGRHLKKAPAAAAVSPRRQAASQPAAAMVVSDDDIPF